MFFSSAIRSEMTENVNTKKMLRSGEFGELGQKIYESLEKCALPGEVMIRDIAYGKYLRRNPEIVKDYNSGLLKLEEVIITVSEECRSLITWVPVRVSQTKNQIEAKIYSITPGKSTLINELTDKFNCNQEDLNKLNEAFNKSSNRATILLYCGKVDNNDAVLVCIID